MRIGTHTRFWIAFEARKLKVIIFEEKILLLVLSLEEEKLELLLTLEEQVQVVLTRVKYNVPSLSIFTCLEGVGML